MKEALVATGSLKECEVVASQLARSSVVDTTKEKPVTKKMLKEVWHWDECLDCKTNMLTFVNANDIWFDFVRIVNVSHDCIHSGFWLLYS